jgi:hypothetical protein
VCCLIKCSWVWLCVKLKGMSLTHFHTYWSWVWFTKPNALRLGYLVNRSRHGSSKLLGPLSLSLAACQAYLYKSLQPSWPINLRVSCMPNLIRHRSSVLFDQMFLSLTTCQAQRHESDSFPYLLTMSLVVCQAQSVTCIEIVINPMLGYKALFVYYYDF